MNQAPLWRWPEICAALELTPQEGPDVYGVGIDSRRIHPGELFVALPGDPGPRFSVAQRSQRDGHDYIDAAVVPGAVGVLAHDRLARPVPQLQVADTLSALWEWARTARGRIQGPVIGVTGSSGKTTTKGLLAAALQAYATSGSLNNHLVVPLSLIGAPAQTGAAVLEIGTSHPGEIAPLAELVQPDVAVVMNVHPAHAEFFASLDELRKEKLSIQVGLGSSGRLVVEDTLLAWSPDDAVGFGTSDHAHVRLLELAGETAHYRIGGVSVVARVPGGGTARAMCLAAVLAVMDTLGLDLEPACTLSDDLIPSGRGNLIQVAGVDVVDDSYNANPESMKAALRRLAAHPGPTLAVLGDMLELGAETRAYHENLAQECGDIDSVIGVGSQMRHLSERLSQAQRAGNFDAADEALIDAITERVRSGHRVLVKGSNRIFWSVGLVGRLVERLQSLSSV